MAYNYNKNTDYKALLDQAAAQGDMKSAALYEAQRNAKIAGEGITDYAPTYDYAKYLPDGGLNAPTYTDTTKTQRDALMAQLLSPQKFTYNAETDPLYKTYAEQYQRNGQKAMQDTLAQVSARTGGLASSYAGQAAQQAYDGYMEQLNSRIPELYQLAYQQYLNEYSQNADKLGLLRQQEQDEYSKYLNAMSQYNADRDWNYTQFLNNAKTTGSRNDVGVVPTAEDPTFNYTEQRFYDYYLNLLNSKSKLHAVTYLNNAVKNGTISREAADLMMAMSPDPDDPTYGANAQDDGAGSDSSIMQKISNFSGGVDDAEDLLLQYGISGKRPETDLSWALAKQYNQPGTDFETYDDYVKAFIYSTLKSNGVI